ncbi:hypothetical protein I4U23_028977 [Adineta vaga]|nr:hypothetical protein I4U23_028977 [Adineta vaga]
MELSDRYNTNDRSEDDFDENIQEFIFCIDHCSNRSQAVRLRTHALTYIDQWRLQRLEQLDERVRTAGHLILNAFDDSLSRRQSVKCPPRPKQSLIKQPPINQSNNSSTSNDISNNYHSYSSEKTDKKIEVSINRMKSSSPNQKKIAINSIDFGRDFTLETLAHLSSPTKDMSMVLCENHTLVYSQNLNELVILPLSNSKQLTSTQLDNNSTIHDLCYVDWLLKCIVITDENVYLLDYRTTQYDLIESGIGYICGAIDNHRSIFYLVKKSTIYKYDKDSLENLQADQYPIADGYNSRRIALDNHTNEHLALLVIANDEKNYILVYSTTSLADGYLYKVMIDDRIERDWICPSRNQGWLVQGSYPGSCFDVNMNGLGSVRVFDCNEIRNMIPFTDNERFVIRTKTDIFIFSKNTDVS